MSTATFDSYVICTSPRSGSTLLCKLLAATGVSGNPESYFHEPSVSSWQTELNLSPDPSVSERDAVRDVFRTAIKDGSLKGLLETNAVVLDQAKAVDPYAFLPGWLHPR